QRVRMPTVRRRFTAMTDSALVITGKAPERTVESTAAMARRASELFTAYQQEIYKSTDRLFAGLMAFQWIAGIVFAFWVSPLAWYGATSRTHVHVWAAIFLGGAICLFPAILGLLRPGETSTRYTIGV